MDNLYESDTINNEIEKMINNNIIYRFKKESEQCFDDERKLEIQKVIKTLCKDKDEYNSKIVNKTKFNDFLDKITNNKFKQNWTRLNYDQKITKFEEYINDNKFEKKQKLIKKIKLMLADNKLITSKEVIYNKDTCKIECIKDFENIIKDI